jgi:hypothetical protein
MNTLHRSIALVALAGGLAAAATGCGSSSHSSADSTSDTPTVTVTQTESSASSTPAPTVTPTTTATSPAATPTCATANLTVTLGQGEGAAGHTIFPLRFTNKGSAPCQLAGFPGVSYVTGTAGTQVGAPATRNGAAGAAVTLLPTGAATAQLSVGSTGPYDPTTCQQVAATGLRVYPPGSTQAAFVAQPLTVCGNPALKTLSVETITAG